MQYYTVSKLDYIRKALSLTVSVFLSPSVKYFTGPNHPAVTEKKRKKKGTECKMIPAL